MPDLNAPMDDIFAQFNNPDSPGVAIGIIQDGAMIFKKGYGMANLELSVPVTPATVFLMASVSKQFTAMAVALLAESGQLSFDDSVHTYFPELPDYGHTITLRHLIHHTSGLRDPILIGDAGGRGIEFVWTEENTLDLVFRQKGLNFPPGSRYEYSNAGYLLLAALVRRISGLSLRGYTDQYIFKPLGMTSTVFRDDHTMLIKNRAYPYWPTENGFRNVCNNIVCVGDSGVCSSIEDLYLWDQNFDHNKLGKGSQAIIELLQSTQALNDGSPNTYAYGLMHETYRGLKTIEHAGGIMGSRANYVRIPDHKLSIIILSNHGRCQVLDLAQKIIDVMLPDLPPVEEPTSTDHPVHEMPTATLQKFVGVYRGTDTGITRRIHMTDDGLRYHYSTLDEYALSPKSETVLTFGTIGSLTFSTLDDGRLKMAERFGSTPPTQYEAVVVAHPTPEELAACVGDFYSPELDVVYSVKLGDDHLIFSQAPSDESILSPTIQDGFHGGTFDVVFERNENGVKGFVFYTDRVHHIEFLRKHPD